MSDVKIFSFKISETLKSQEGYNSNALFIAVSDISIPVQNPTQSVILFV